MTNRLKKTTSSETTNQTMRFFFSPVKWSNAKNTLNSNVDVTRQFHSNCFGRQFSSIRYYFLMLMLSDFIS